MKIIKNIFFGSISVFVRAAGNILFFAILARAVGVNDFGILTLAVTLSQIFISIVDYGFNLYVSKQIAENKPKVISETSGILVTKNFLTILCSILIFLISWTLGYSSTQILVISIIWVGSLFYSYGFYFNSIFRSINKFSKEATSNTMMNIFQVLFAALLYIFKGDVVLMSLAYTIARIVYFFQSYMQVLTEFGKLNWGGNWITIKVRLKEILPYGIHIILALLYFQSDTIFLSYFGNAEQVGLYQSAMRIVVGISVVSDLIVSSFFPAIAAFYNNSEFNSFSKSAKNLHKYCVSIGLFIGCGFIVFADSLIKTVYGAQFTNAVYLLKILSIVISLRFIGASYGALITITGNQQSRAIAVGISLITNISALFIFVPKYGASGAAYASLVTHLVLISVYFFINLKAVKTSFINSSAVIMCLTVILLSAISQMGKNFNDILGMLIFITGLLIIFYFVVLSTEERKHLYLKIIKR